MKNSGGPLKFSRKLAGILRHEGFRGVLLRYRAVADAVHGEQLKLTLKGIFAKKAHNAKPIKTASTTIIIPIYNGLHHLEALCQTLFDRSPAGTNYIFIDDCSPDEGIQAYLSTFAGYPGVRILRNEKNLGFTGTVNRAAGHVTTEHFVLLNSDVIVHENWLPRLLAPLHSDSKIASVTPFSNAAVFFSFPKVAEDNRVDIDGIAPEEIDAAFARIDGTITPECETYAGVGFCMAISNACWHEIGPLDEEAFGRGYGEEVDWCLRARAHGWRNVIAPDLYIQHIHGGSFSSEEKKFLSGKNLKIVHERWPTLGAEVQKHVEDNPWEAYRAMAALLLADTGNGCVFMIDYGGVGGGAYAYREKTIADLQDQDKRVLLLTYSHDKCEWILTMRYLGDLYQVKLDAVEEICEIFSTVPVKHVIVNNLAFCTEVERVLAVLGKLKKSYGFPIDYKLHDYFSICPSFFLLDPNSGYCGGGLSIAKCADCSKANQNFIVERRGIPAWRAMWGAFLPLCDEITAFSQSSLDILKNIYPLSGKTRVVEHTPLEEFKVAYTPPPKEAPLVIGFLGTFVDEKGANYILTLADILKEEGKGAKIVIFGPYPQIIDHPNLEFSGRYRHEDIPALCNKWKVKVVVFPSPWPETFSYISQECMMLGIPFVCFDIGAPAERIRKYGYEKGVIAADFTAEALRIGVAKLVE